MALQWETYETPHQNGYHRLTVLDFLMCESPLKVASSSSLRCWIEEDASPVELELHCSQSVLMVLTSETAPKTPQHTSLPNMTNSNNLKAQLDEVIASLVRRHERMAEMRAAGTPEASPRLGAEKAAKETEIRVFVEFSAKVRAAQAQERSFDRWWTTLGSAEREQRIEDAWREKYHQPRRRD
ncbi:uncharacterized protein K460DRAFT_406417 [Cucurbitaria berberidis CBS 394.84]|uniref:Uncharacterized protein n=1 Tax=Cucurbitaria berberidis CBS 394.84 TaxID=1168544 RepID=A0A9P4GIG7_9PLEO|nr:uncharacterized protein K460DRAFT_406417 [Cucurbitaria berberidis CBS 394.84]KAF1846195.1 hypothetical protein K460DRAFT_406417 [Cucurbitaria berberidis CBS 394.84]